MSAPALLSSLTPQRLSLETAATFSPLIKIGSQVFRIFVFQDGHGRFQSGEFNHSQQLEEIDCHSAGFSEVSLSRNFGG